MFLCRVVNVECCYAECHRAECYVERHYAECHYADSCYVECRGAISALCFVFYWLTRAAENIRDYNFWCVSKVQGKLAECRTILVKCAAKSDV